MIKLYDYFRASSCYRLRMALNLKGLEFETIPVDLVKGEHGTEEYKAINPLGTVPYFIDATDDNKVELNQSLAIMQYLDNQYPETKLVFGNAEQQAYIWQLALLIATDIHPFGAPQVWRKYLMGILEVNQDQANQWVDHWITRGLIVYEALLVKSGKMGDFSCGDQISMADICLLPQLYNARRYKVDLSPFPNLMQIEKNMLRNSAIQKATPEVHQSAPEGFEQIHGANMV
jgi:maleylacetoacetate isomerase